MRRRIANKIIKAGTASVRGGRYNWFQWERARLRADRRKHPVIFPRRIVFPILRTPPGPVGPAPEMF